LPASRSEVFYTVYDNQDAVDVDVFQGESEDVRNNHRIGRFLIQGLAKVPSGNALLVSLNLNLDGILKVTARERATGLQKEIVIENALARFESEERSAAQARLDQFWDETEGEVLAEEMGAEVAPEEAPALVPATHAA